MTRDDIGAVEQKKSFLSGRFGRLVLTKEPDIQVFDASASWNELLVGGFKHDFYCPFHIWDVILPIDELHHFSRWLVNQHCCSTWAMPGESLWFGRSRELVKDRRCQKVNRDHITVMFFWSVSQESREIELTSPFIHVHTTSSDENLTHPNISSNTPTTVATCGVGQCWGSSSSKRTSSSKSTTGVSADGSMVSHYADGTQERSHKMCWGIRQIQSHIHIYIYIYYI